MKETVLRQGAISAEKNTVEHYYNNATDYYAYWSSNFNMHFGYGFAKFWKREYLLESMNAYALSKLNVNDKVGETILDMGFGMAATLRHAARKFKHAGLHGINGNASQIRKATELNKKSGLEDRIHLHKAFFTEHDSPETYDGIYAVESLCHEANKKLLYKRVYTNLKPGGRFVIADAFLKRSRDKSCKVFNKLFDTFSEGWAVHGINEIEKEVDELELAGFEVEVENLFWKIAPSVLHNPVVIAHFLFDILRGKVAWTSVAKHHLKAAFLSSVIGLHVRDMGYFLITAKKKKS